MRVNINYFRSVIYFVTFFVASGSLGSAYAQKSADGSGFGSFNGEVIASFLSDGRNVKLESLFTYIDPQGVEWPVPAGMMTDGASVPRAFWTIYPPFTGKYRSAAIVHDYYCQTKSRSWKRTHEVFYFAMMAAGVEVITAKTMYAAVYYFGPRWGVGSETRAPGASKHLTLAQEEKFMSDLKIWIAEKQPTLDQIRIYLEGIN